MPAIEPPQRFEISDAELERLDQLLRERALPHGGLSLEAVDGFFSALIVGPGMVMPSEYMNHIWGEDAPSWESIEQAREALNLVMALWNFIARRVRLDPESAADATFPLLALPSDMRIDDVPDLERLDFPVGADWAAGFLFGVSLRAQGWEERLTQSEELVEDFEALQSLLLSGEEDEESAQTQSKLNFRERLAILGEMTYLLYDMNRWRLEELTPRQPVRRGPTSGRNDPCPCGSGKKFKKCCGDPSRLH